MPKTLAELRAGKPVDRPERAYTVCLAPHLVAEVQALTEELDGLPDVDTDDEPDGPPKRMGQGQNPRAVEIQARLRELLDEMADYEGELRVRANRTDGEWRQWVNEHPARGEDEPGHKRDMTVTYGYCNADALLDDLGTYVHSWNSEPLGEGDWAMLNVGNPDKKRIAALVVAMYESDLNLPSWRRALSSNLGQGATSNSPVSSESVSAGSSAGKRKSGTSTTTPKAT